MIDERNGFFHLYCSVYKWEFRSFCQNIIYDQQWEDAVPPFHSAELVSLHRHTWKAKARLNPQQRGAAMLVSIYCRPLLTVLMFSTFLRQDFIFCNRGCCAGICNLLGVRTNVQFSGTSAVVLQRPVQSLFCRDLEGCLPVIISLSPVQLVSRCSTADEYKYTHGDCILFSAQLLTQAARQTYM